MIRLSTINNKIVKGAILILVSVNLFYSNRKIPFNYYAQDIEVKVLHWKPAHQDEDSQRTSNDSGYNEQESSAISYQFPQFPYPKACHFESPPDGLGTSYDVALFYHVGLKNSWAEIVRDQLDTLETCGLGYMASSMTISYHISPSVDNYTVDDLKGILDHYPFVSQLNLSYFEARSGPIERDIMEFMYRTCLHSTNSTLSEEKKLLVVYFHSKGISYTMDDSRFLPVLYWRKYIEFFLLEKPTLCLRALLHHGAHTCGTNWNPGISWHYSGNFWAASCEWISQLPATIEVPPDDPYGYTAAERWIGSSVVENDHFKFVNLFDSGTLGNPYEEIFLPDRYSDLAHHANGKFSSEWVGNYSALWVEYLEYLGIDWINISQQVHTSVELPKVMIFITTHFTDEHQNFLQQCWPASISRSPLLQNSDIFVFSTGETNRSLLKYVFPNNRLEIHEVPNPGYHEGAILGFKLAGRQGWFDNYDWVIRLNPDVIIKNDTEIIRHIMRPDVDGIFIDCEPGTVGADNITHVIHTDWIAFRPRALPEEKFTADFGHAETNARQDFDSILQSGRYVWLPFSRPKFWGHCRVTGGVVQHLHDFVDCETDLQLIDLEH